METTVPVMTMIIAAFAVGFLAGRWDDRRCVDCGHLQSQHSDEQSCSECACTGRGIQASKPAVRITFVSRPAEWRKVRQYRATTWTVSARMMSPATTMALRRRRN
jgi:hypothetical protein